MEIRAGSNVITGANATVTMDSQDHITIGYKNPRGEWNTFCVSAQHLIFLATHEQSEATLLIRPSTGVQVIPPTK